MGFLSLRKENRSIYYNMLIDLFDPMKPGLVSKTIRSRENTARRELSQWWRWARIYRVRLFGIFESVGKWWDLEWSSTLKPETLSMMRTSQLADGVKVASQCGRCGTGFGCFAIKLRQKRTIRTPWANTIGAAWLVLIAGCRLEQILGFF